MPFTSRLNNQLGEHVSWHHSIPHLYFISIQFYSLMVHRPSLLRFSVVYFTTSVKLFDSIMKLAPTDRS
jgi:hypothetical protein